MSFYGIFFPRAAYYAGTKGEISLTGLVISTRRPASDFRSCFAAIASLSPSAVRRKYSPTVDLPTLRIISKGALCHLSTDFRAIYVSKQRQKTTENFIIFFLFWIFFASGKYIADIINMQLIYATFAQCIEPNTAADVHGRSRSKLRNRRWSFELFYNAANTKVFVSPR